MDAQDQNQDQSLTTSSNQPRAFGAIHDQAILSWKLFWDKRVSVFAKLVPLGTIAYIFSPFDFIPELLLPVIGPLVILDDIGILLLALTFFSRLAPPDVVQEYRRLMGGNLPETEGYYSDDVIDAEVEVIDD